MVLDMSLQNTDPFIVCMCKYIISCVILMYAVTVWCLICEQSLLQECLAFMKAMGLHTPTVCVCVCVCVCVGVGGCILHIVMLEPSLTCALHVSFC